MLLQLDVLVKTCFNSKLKKVCLLGLISEGNKYRLNKRVSDLTWHNEYIAYDLSQNTTCVQGAEYADCD